MAAQDAARHLWSRTDLKPPDVDTANVYDGFPSLTIVWLESLGLCGYGEAPAFAEGGQNIGPGGVLPHLVQTGQYSLIVFIGGMNARRDRARELPRPRPLAAVAPEVFELYDEEYLATRSHEVSHELEEAARKGAHVCPENVISVHE